MRILSRDPKKGVKVRIEDLDDLWTLSSVIEAGDIVSGVTMRKIKIMDKQGNVTKVDKQRVRLDLEVEKVEFHEHSGMLRVSGVVTEGSEEVPRGSHHTFNLEPGKQITMKKERWLSFHFKKLEEKPSTPILIVVLDREQAIIAAFERRGKRILAKMHGQVPKKGEPTQSKNTFLTELAKAVKDYAARLEATQLVVASPSFWREQLRDLLPDELKKRATLATCTSATESALSELARRPELAQALRQDRLSREARFVEDIMEAIASAKPVAYGRDEVSRAVWAGAIQNVLLSTDYLTTQRRESKYDELESLLKHAEGCQAEVHLIDSTHEGGKRLDSIGGIAALLRYPLPD